MSTRHKLIQFPSAWSLFSVALIVLALSGCEVNHEAIAEAEKKERIARGEYLVSISGCHDCHTPHVLGPAGVHPDMSRALSGHPASFEIAAPPSFDAPEWAWAGTPTNTAFAGPWGVSFAANLTPDEATGIGIWTEEQFVQTIRTGRHWGVDRPILPPMPWPAYANMTDEDLAAVFTYLQSIEPMANPVPRPLPPQLASN